MLCFVVSVLPGSCTVAGILVILDSCSASLFLGSRFVVDMILYLVVVATFHQISDFFLGISFFFFGCKFQPWLPNSQGFQRNGISSSAGVKGLENIMVAFASHLNTIRFRTTVHPRLLLWGSKSELVV